MTKKPPYRIPSMSEIRKVKPNGLNVVSTFSGCGGACLGFRMAGYRVLWASEFVPAAAETYRANFPDVPLSTADVREVTPEQIREESGLAGEIDVLEGSPPCASFSTAGRRQEGWGVVRKYSDVEQRVDDLFFEFVRLVQGLQPKTFVAENVAGLARGVSRGYLREILAAFRDCGYRVDGRILDAQWLGVPQVRKRLVFVGIRNDLGHDPVFPTPLPYRYAVADALPWIVQQASNAPYGATGWNDAAAEPSQTIGASPSSGNGLSPPSVVVAQKVAIGEDVGDDVGATLEGYSVGEEWDRLAPGESSDRYFNLVRPDADAPLPTLTASGAGIGKMGAPGGVASVTHPTEKRKLSIGELRRLCGFPDDFVLTGSYGQRWERLGRAVPPPMYAAVAARLRDVLGAAPQTGATRGRGPLPPPPDGRGRPRGRRRPASSSRRGASA